jgi:HK97 family phage major capsid protein
MKTRKEKAARLAAIQEEIVALTSTIEGDAEKNDTPENREKLIELLTEGEGLKTEIETGDRILGLKSFTLDPKTATPVGGDGAFSQPFEGAAKSIGEQFVESAAYKKAIDRTGGDSDDAKLNIAIDIKGFLFPDRSKATFTLGGTGLDSTVNYVNAGNMIMIEQQKLTIRDLLAVGETTMNSIPYIKETLFTNAADTVAEEGQKPEATLTTDDATAPVKKIAVLIKVTDEVFADFPMMRDYVNSRLRFMVLQKEEDQLLNGTGVGAQITGILQTSGILTQARGADTNADAIFKAITKVRTPAASVAGYEPDALVIHPTDWQSLKLAKDLNNQYYGGGPFTGPYGVGGVAGDTYWGLRVVVTTAIAQGTCLVGAFKIGAQIWQREGVRVEAFDQNEDDVNFNRVTVRVEERLALAVYRASAFCTVTSLN